MRMRKKKNGEARLSACAELLLNHDGKIGEDALRSVFGNDHPVRLEIGCGKGNFILNTAMKHPDINFIAMERISDVMVICAEKIKASGISNVRLLVADAREIPERFDDGIFDVIYLNFSDPWPKSGHYKRRLTYRDFLSKYKNALKDDGALFIKTDNRPFFDFSLEELAFSGFRLENITNDLHNSPFAEDNVQTEYEANFAAQGVPINRVEAYKS